MHQKGDGRGNGEGLLGAKEQTQEVEPSSGPSGWRAGSRLGVVGEKVQGGHGPCAQHPSSSSREFVFGLADPESLESFLSKESPKGECEDAEQMEQIPKESK